MIKISEYPPNFLPANTIPISATDEESGYQVKGFYDPSSGEMHIQEVIAPTLPAR